MNTVKTDNKIINIFIFYVILLVIPIVIPELYNLFNGYYTTLILFGILVFRYYNCVISPKKVLIVFTFILLQYLGLSTSGIDLSIESFVLPLMYAVNMVSLFIITDGIKIDKNGLIKFYDFYLYFAVVFSIYNFIHNYKIIINLLNMSGSLEGLMIASAFRNRNAFGFVLVLAIISGVYLYFATRKKKYIYYLSFIGLNIIITFSRNSIITSTLFFVVFLWFFFKNERQKILYAVVSVSSLAAIILSNKKINSLIFNALIRADAKLSKREIAWRYFFNNMDVRDYLIGSGVGSTQDILKSINFYSYHNSILDLVGTGGIISLIIYVVVVVYFIRYYYKVSIKYPLEGSVFLASIVAFQFYYMFESIVLQVGIGFNDVLVALFTYVLPILYLKNYKSSELGIRDNYYKNKVLSS